MAGLHQVALDAVADSVPAVRRFVRNLPSLAGVDPFDLELVVTELVSNAVLHGAAPVEVRMFEVRGGLRVEVADGGKLLPTGALTGPDAMTGRGLALVAALADEWGIEPQPGGGKVVWARLAGAADEPGVDHQAAGSSSPHEDWSEVVTDVTDAHADQPLYSIDLGPVPTALLVEAKTHIDNVVRELTIGGLRELDWDEPVPGATERLIRIVTGTFADARAQLRALAIEAARLGQKETRISLRLPASAADAAGIYMAALDEADIYSRAAQLLTLPAPPTHRVFRRWYLQSIAEQLRSAAAGEQRPLSRTFVQALADEVIELAGLRDERRRLEVLQRVSEALAQATGVDEIVSTVVDNARRHLGAHTAWVYLLGDDGFLHTAALHTDNPEWAARFSESSLDAPTPAATVVRTGQPVILRSVEQIEAAFPILRGVYRGERTLHVTPLAVSGLTIGVLALSYRPASRIDEPTRLSFASALSAMLAQALARAMSQRKLQEANERLAFLADASTALSASLDTEATLDAVCRLVVPRLADCIAVHLLESGVLATVKVRYAEADKQAWAGEWASRYPPRMDSPRGAAVVVRTGVSEVIEDIPESFFEEVTRSDEHLAMVRQIGMCSALTVPLVGRHGTIGVLSLGYTGFSARRYTRADVPFVEDVARRAALAIEAARMLEARSGELPGRQSSGPYGT